jgi:hypothetical protein
MPNFSQLATTPILKIQKFHLTIVDFQPKKFLILYPSLENFTTGIAINTTSWDNHAPNKVKAKGIIWLKGIQMGKAIYLSSFCCLLEYL